jgi:hypothetical protein
MEIDAGDLRGPLARQAGDTIATDDVLAVLKPIWTTKAETASRVRGRIEKVLDAAKPRASVTARTLPGGAAIWTTFCRDRRSWPGPSCGDAL